MRKRALLTVGILVLSAQIWASKSVIDQARELETKEMYKEAETYLATELSQNPPKSLRYQILIELADLEFQHLSKPDKALAYLLEAKTLYSDRYPHMDEVYYRLGLVYEALGQYVEAAKAFETVATKYRKSDYFDDALAGVERAFKKNFKEWLAVVNGTPITKLELEERIQNYPPFYRGRYESPEGKKELLDRMIDEMTLYKEAEAQKLYLDSDVTKELRQSRMQILERAIYKREVKDKVKVTDAEITKYYKEHKKEYVIPAKVDIRRVVVKSREDAQKVIEEAKKGTHFDSLAMKYSISPDARKGGLLQNLTESSKPEELVKAAFKLKEGEISDIIALPDSTYAVIKVEKKKPETLRTLDQVKELIESKLRQKKERERWENYRKTLRKKYGVMYSDEFKKYIEEKIGKKIDIEESSGSKSQKQEK